MPNAKTTAKDARSQPIEHTAWPGRKVISASPLNLEKPLDPHGQDRWAQPQRPPLDSPLAHFSEQYPPVVVASGPEHLHLSCLHFIYVSPFDSS